MDPQAVGPVASQCGFGPCSAKPHSQEVPVSDHSPEDEYFARLDREKTAALKQKIDEEEAEKSAESRKELHWNRCGKCGTQMVSRPFRGVEIELCPGCGAVLLDHGELEQLAGNDQTGAFRALFSMFGVD